MPIYSRTFHDTHTACNERPSAETEHKIYRNCLPSISIRTERTNLSIHRFESSQNFLSKHLAPHVISILASSMNFKQRNLELHLTSAVPQHMLIFGGFILGEMMCGVCINLAAGNLANCTLNHVARHIPIAFAVMGPNDASDCRYSRTKKHFTRQFPREN